MNKQQLLKHPDLWLAGQLADANTHQQASIATGYTALNEHLPGNGWPAAGLMEFMLKQAGIGELRLLAPALQTLSQTENRWIAWINPPFIPYAPALESVGIDTRKILLIHPRRNPPNNSHRSHHRDSLWALERACKSSTCSAALAWLDEKKLKLKDTQRLQLAAKKGGTLTCLFRPQTAHKHASMAELRLAVHHQKNGEVQVDVLKRRGGWPIQNITLPVAQTTGTQHQHPIQIQQQLTLWRAQQYEQLHNSKQQNNEHRKKTLLTEHPTTKHSALGHPALEDLVLENGRQVH